MLRVRSNAEKAKSISIYSYSGYLHRTNRLSFRLSSPVSKGVCSGGNLGVHSAKAVAFALRSCSSRCSVRTVSISEAHLGGSLTLLLSHDKPSKIPSPVTAQLGSTFQIWPFALRLSSSLSDTSCGRIASMSLVYIRSRKTLTSSLFHCILTPSNILFIRKHQQQRILHLAILYYRL